MWPILDERYTCTTQPALRRRSSERLSIGHGKCFTQPNGNLAKSLLLPEWNRDFAENQKNRLGYSQHAEYIIWDPISIGYPKSSVEASLRDSWEQNWCTNYRASEKGHLSIRVDLESINLAWCQTDRTQVGRCGTDAEETSFTSVFLLEWWVSRLWTAKRWSDPRGVEDFLIRASSGLTNQTQPLMPWESGSFNLRTSYLEFLIRTDIECRQKMAGYSKLRPRTLLMVTGLAKTAGS